LDPKGLQRVALRRLRAQRLIGAPFASPVEAVRSLVAVQSQDYAGAKWALGMRVRGATDRALEKLLDEGALLRTHVLRPTWHFILPDDARWLLELTAPRIEAAMASYDRRLALDAKVFSRAYAVLERSLRGAAHRTRAELSAALEQARIPAQGLRMINIMIHAELAGLVTSGPRRGKQFTYALLEERAPRARRLDRDAALAELASRYFTGHGPAQLQDFSWWSGLSPADARRALSHVERRLRSETLDGKTYYASPEAKRRSPSPSAHLLPNFDEYFIAYRDRSATVDASLKLGASAPFPYGKTVAHVVMVDGVVRGAWKRFVRADHVDVELGPLDAHAVAAIRPSIDRLGAFLETLARVASRKKLAGR
jgi:hypothetical protein